ncbi:Clp protease ClpP [Macrococcus caseolyticus]|uniref:head maturation protease, ClpP-related n=1 Tax=Macrococcoides caseolyticum TaxID=69966 RepID=UPI0024BCA3EC|nr:head maturation protease, ClpP-related [Macrococcus caseolyticus]MDJ1154499.1 Clp protease ClpP [Macrococcus caseolyticus]
MKLEVKGAIVPNDDKWIYELFEMDATSPKDITDQLKDATGDIEVLINSGGGDVYSGSEIYTALRDVPNNVNVKIVGIAASAASVIAMAGDKVEISPTAQIMIHNAATVAFGDNRSMEHTSNMLEGFNKSIANAYMDKTGLSQDEILSMMDDETWLTADMAVEKGFADSKMFAENTPRLVANAGQMLSDDVINRVSAIMNKTPEVKIDVDAIAEKVIEKMNNKTETEPEVKNGLKRFFF